MKRPAPRATDIMDSKPITVTADAVVREAAEAMWKGDSPVAVLIDDEDHPQAVLSQQGLMLALLDIVNHGMPAGPLRQYVDPGLSTIDENTGLLHMAELFVRMGAAVRALPVVRDEKLVGLVVRRNVVQAVMEYLKGVEDLEQRVLYLSALRDTDETPHFE
jgi:predicted transcriptional regulator